MGPSGKLAGAAIVGLAATIILSFPAMYVADDYKDLQLPLFSSFNKDDDNNFFFLEGDANINNEAIQVTPDSMNDEFSLLNRSGRAIFRRRFKLWEEGDEKRNNSSSSSSSSKRVASFTSTFVVNVYRPRNDTPGEGLAFVIVPNTEIPSGSKGPWLGLTNSTIDGNRTNQLMAIELDTVKQDWDPDDNHIGLNINSVISENTYSLSNRGFEIAPKVATNYTIWVEYNGSSMAMEVYMDLEGQPKPTSPVLNTTINLKDVVSQYSYFGFSASTGETAQLNCVLKWNLTVDILPEDDDLSPAKLAMAITLPIAGASVIIVGLCFCYFIRRRRIVDDPNILGALKSLPGTPREFQFKDLKKATNNFDEKLKLGEGGFGVVYKGILPEDNIEVAVKKFSRENMKGKDDFLAELTIINRLRHKHLVRLVGWCHKNGMLLLVYDYMPNGSLDQHLFDAPENVLSWDKRYNIIMGVASALHYLHDEYDQKVVHRDLKASNVLLDSCFNARLGDFGLARAIDNERTSYAELEGVPGTMGYIAPECFHTGKATRESDVFGFGAVVLEVVCGLRPKCNIEGYHFLVDWVWNLYAEGRILDAVDERVGVNYMAEDAERLLLLGLACSHPIQSDRPKTQAIVQIISRSVKGPLVPLKKPSFVWPMPMEMESPNIGSPSIHMSDTTPMASSFYGSEWSTHYNSRDGRMDRSDSSLV